LRRFQKTVSVGAEVTSATGNACLPTVDSRVRQITRCEDEDDQRRWRLESAKHC